MRRILKGGAIYHISQRWELQERHHIPSRGTVFLSSASTFAHLHCNKICETLIYSGYILFSKVDTHPSSAEPFSTHFLHWTFLTARKQQSSIFFLLSQKLKKCFWTASKRRIWVSIILKGQNKLVNLFQKLKNYVQLLAISNGVYKSQFESNDYLKVSKVQSILNFFFKKKKTD